MQRHCHDSERQSYLDAPYGVAVVAADARTTSGSRCCTSISITIFFAVGGMFAAGIRLELLTPQGRSVDAGPVQQALHAARRHDDLLLPDPVDSGDARQLPDADHVRREGPRVPAHQPAQLVPLRHRRASSTLGGGRSAAGSTPAGRSTRPTARSASTDDRSPRRRSASSSPASRRFSPASTSSSPCTACARPALTWFRLPLFVWAHVRHEPGDDPRHAGHRDHGAARRRRAHAAPRLLRPDASAATRCCSSTCSGSTRTRRSTS